MGLDRQSKVRRLKVLVAVAVSLLVASPVLAEGGTFNGFPTVRLVINGTEATPDVPPVIMGGRTLVPVRVVSETLGLRVGWDERTRTVTVDDPFSVKDYKPTLDAGTGTLRRLAEAMKRETDKPLTAQEELKDALKELNRYLRSTLLVKPPEGKEELHFLLCSAMLLMRRSASMLVDAPLHIPPEEEEKYRRMAEACNDELDRLWKEAAEFWPDEYGE